MLNRNSGISHNLWLYLQFVKKKKKSIVFHKKKETKLELEIDTEKYISID